METTFRNAQLVAWVLIVGSVFFILAEYVYKRYQEHSSLTVRKGITIGFFQTLALVPGMSRSGATIAGGMLMGLSRETAARFSFLLAIPIILGSGVKKIFDLSSTHTPSSEWGMIVLASSIAFISGIISIHFLLKYLRNHSLNIFAAYRILLAFLVFTLL
jgi:undecaprenyl-diphosphatase